MKKVIAFAVAVCMALGCCALAVEIDFSKLTDGELYDIIMEADQEMYARLVEGDARFEKKPADDEKEDAEEAAADVVEAAKTESSDDYVKMRKGSMIYNDNGIKIKIVDNPKDHDAFGELWIDLDVVIENKSEHDVSISSLECYMNGWSIGNSLLTSVKAGKSAKETISFMECEDANVSTVKDVEEIVMGLYIVDSNDYSSITDFDYSVTMKP